ncbi:helix-turn-helix domain-containing protein [Dactylosporangium sp. NBC_01737]|uniref:helix-turn-helix domain-containing protein n=1 Tax=Dactylosporangium sp. NBC_01737 TaxID=2975959 RepID=UPI002E159CF3|nr:helix-turn-helix domain-containing protein [Dactylosporangium sp. NBC_01737]
MGDGTGADVERLRALRTRLAEQLMAAHREAGEPSYRVIAGQVGVSKATVFRLLNGIGERSPKWHHIDDMLEVFGRSDREVERLRALWMQIRELEKPQ